MNFDKKKYKKIYNKLFKAMMVINLIFIFSCNIDKPPPEVSKYWIKKDVTPREKSRIMMGCGYPDTGGALGYGLSTNEIAEIHICMIKNGFKYSSSNGHFCKNYPHLPACEKARKENVIE